MLKISDYLSSQDAADYLGVTAFTVRKWEKEGKLKSCTNPVNNYKLYRQEDLEELLRIIANSSSQNKK